MSIICKLRQVDSTDISNLVSNPEQLASFLYRGKSQDEEFRKDELSLVKAWGGIHFLVTESRSSSSPAFSYLLFGGDKIDDKKMGYGPARALSLNQVADFDSAISTIMTKEFRDRYDPVMMYHNIYPGISEGHYDDDDPLEYLVLYFKKLKSFIRKSVRNQKALLIYFT